MKKTVLYFLFITSVLLGCRDRETPDFVADDDEIAFQGKSAVIKSSNTANLRFKDIPGSVTVDEATPQGEIRVSGAQDLQPYVQVKNEGGELRIEGKGNVPSNLDLNFHISPLDIRKIVVEGQNRVYIGSTPVLDHLELVTEGGSQLLIDDMKVRNLISRREGSSRMVLSSERPGFTSDSLFFEADAVQVLDNRYIIYRENNLDYMLYAPRIRVSGGSVYALPGGPGDPLRSYFISQTHELRNEGSSTLDALELPTLQVTSRNEGSSESRVWAVNQLNVRGEGESVMYYIGSPQISERLEGSASLIKLR